MLTPHIDPEKCTGCGLCVEVCRNGGLELVNSIVVFIGADNCDWCGLCEAVCPSGAIGCPFDIIFDEP